MKTTYLVLAIASTLSLHAAVKEPLRPNVLLITADDLNWDSLGCTGSPLPGISPNLDRFASQSLLIDRCHIATPICGPSRHALYTGQLPQRSGYLGHGTQPPRWWKANNPSVNKKSIASELHKAGYVTGVIGKHGSHWCKFSVSPFTQNAQTGVGRNPEKYYRFVRDFFDKSKKEGKPFYLTANAHDPHRYWARHRDETKSWLNAQMKSDTWKPLENGKPYPDPKTNYDPTKIPMPDAYPDDDRLRSHLAPYYDSVNRMDQVVGEVLRALDESGMADNTIVIFLSDHGLAWEMSKWSLYQSGTRTPLIIRWPNRVKPGTRDSTSVVSIVDIAPTIADLCRIPPLTKIDGTSLRPLIDGNPSKWKRKTAFSCFNYMNNEKEYEQAISVYSNDLHKKVEQYRPSRALTSNKFTYVWNGWSDGTSQLPRTMKGEFSTLLKKHAGNGQDPNYPEYKAHADFINHRVPEELYDTSKDPGCLNNLANNPEYRPVMKTFRSEMATTLKQTGDHEFDNFRSAMMKTPN